MSGGQIAIIVIAVALLILAILYFVGNKLQKKQNEQKAMMAEAAQPCTMMIIDKKMMKMKEAGLPKAIMEQTPKRMMNAKIPIVKAKIGPQIVNLICDDAIYDEVPVKGEVKAMLSGIYLVSVKNVRGKIKKDEKKTLTQKVRAKQRQYEKELAEEEKRVAEKKAAKKNKKK